MRTASGPNPAVSAVRLVHTAERIREWTRAYRRAGLCVGFVPTLGGLHAGHSALLRQARQECDRVVASIYLNPTQFDCPEDLDGYPSTREEDVSACRAGGVDLLWLGRSQDFLSEGFQTWVEVEELTSPLCGAGRPGHFRGVTTVVMQLLQVVLPHRVYFGLKDYQQTCVVTRMAEDLNLDVEIRLVETVREPDGLALSSRNARLAPPQRQAALVIWRALSKARRRVLDGERSVEAVSHALCTELQSEPLVRVEYADVRDARTLELLETGELRLDGAGTLLAIAVQLGPVRLIDNVVLRREGTGG